MSVRSEELLFPGETASQSIRELANESLERIESIALDQPRQAWVAGQQTRLQIFDDILGDNAENLHQSADFILQEHPELKRTILSLLTAVLMNIVSCERFVIEKDDSSESGGNRVEDIDDDSRTSGIGSQTRQQLSSDPGLKPGFSVLLSNSRIANRFDHTSYKWALERIERDIGSLLRFTSHFRTRSSFGYLHDEYANAYNPEGLEDSRKPSSETQTIAKTIADRVRREMKLENGEEDLNRVWVRLRLEKVAMQRWSRISYCKHRFIERRSKAPSDNTVIYGDRGQARNQRQSVAVFSGNEPLQNQYPAISGAPSKILRDATTDSSDLKATPDSHWQAPLTEVISAIEDDENINVAPPLRIVHQGSSWEFTCPLCRSAETIKARSKSGFVKKWQKHALHDLAPYICVAEYCPTPMKAFRTVADWKHHRESKHSFRGWICEDCDANKHYTEEQAYIDHLTGPPHYISAERDELQFLAQTTVRKVSQELLQCLVCNSSTGREDDDDPKDRANTAPQQEAILRCMLNHMKEVSAASLPEGLSLASSADAEHGSSSDSGHNGETNEDEGRTCVFVTLRREALPAEEIDVRIKDWSDKIEDAAEDQSKLERRERLLTQVQISEQGYSGNPNILSELKQSILIGDVSGFVRLLRSFEHFTSCPYLLHFAALFNELEIAEKLLECGTDVNATCSVRCMSKNIVNATPLHIAAGAQHRSMVLCLLKKGSNIFASDGQSTPIGWLLNRDWIKIASEASAPSFGKTLHLFADFGWGQSQQVRSDGSTVMDILDELHDAPDVCWAIHHVFGYRLVHVASALVLLQRAIRRRLKSLNPKRWGVSIVGIKRNKPIS